MGAVSKLRDQEYLTEIAKNNSNDSVRLAAADKLDDKTLAQVVFMNIAQTSSDGETRLDAVKRFRDQSLAQSVYLDIATNKDFIKSARKAAAEMLKVTALWRRVYYPILRLRKRKLHGRRRSHPMKLLFLPAPKHGCPLIHTEGELNWQVEGDYCPKCQGFR